MKLLPMCLTAALAAAPPMARRADQVDDYHGVKIADPYRWLEDTDAPETRVWIEGQNKNTREYLDAAPRREETKARLRELYQFERFLSWREKAGRVFYRLQSANQNQPVLYLQSAGKDRALIDPNQLDPAGLTSMGSFSVSNDGRLIAYSLSKAGSDWLTWHVLDIDAGKDLPDVLDWSKFSEAVWDTTGAGFYYCRYPKPEGGLLTARNVNYKVYYHRLRTQQADDKLVYERPDHPEWSFNPKLSEDGRYLVLIVEDGTSTLNRVEYIDLKASAPKPAALISEFYAAFAYLGNRGDVLYFSTTYSAPRGRVVAIDLKRPARDQWKQLVAETKDTLAQAHFTKGSFVLNYLRDVAGKVILRLEDGSRPREMPLPPNSSLGLAEDSTTVFHVSGFTQPGNYYRCEASACKPVRSLRLSFDPEQYESRQVFYPSKDGTKIPMFLVSKKGAPASPRPALLYAYGGFNISTTPGFNPLRLAWMERGGLLAVANLRGGGEYGEDWHHAGMKDKKQNVFDDFIAAGEYLVKSGLTTREKLAINGGSNGGLLVGAVVNQRPDLFAAAVPAVGVMDMLRFHQFTVGRGWTPEYGSPDNAEDFRVIAKYSPLHNIKSQVRYPAVLVLTGDHDDRVVPGHSFKYAAALQAAQAGPAPVLIRIETSAGHGGGKPVSKQIEEGADVLAFLARVLVQ